MASIPNKLRVFLPYQTENGFDFSEHSFIDVDVRDQNDEPLWYEKELNGKMIDVVAVPLHDIQGIYIPIEEAEEPFNEGVKAKIASDVFVIGFPFGKQAGYFPIWKRASVASEPNLDVNDFPYYFVDTATRSGMSGSPVVLYKDRPAIMFDQSTGQVSRHWTKFVGIYSGRIGADGESNGDAQLGRVWKPHVIQELIDLYEK